MNLPKWAKNLADDCSDEDYYRFLKTIQAGTEMENKTDLQRTRGLGAHAEPIAPACDFLCGLAEQDL